MRPLAPLALLLALALPASAATYPMPLVGNLGPAYTGQAGTVGYKVTDASGTVRIARTTAGIAEAQDSAGNATQGVYLATATWDTSWGVCAVLWDVPGSVVAPGVVGQDPATYLAGGGTVTSTVTASSVTSPVTVGTNNDKSGYGLINGQTVAGVTGNVSGSVGSVTNPVAVSGAVQVGSYATGQDPVTLLGTAGFTNAPTVDQIAAGLLIAPANKLATDGAGRVAASNLPADYQQRGAPVTLPDSAPAGYGPASPAPSARTVDHNYGSADALRYLAPGGAPVAAGYVRAYLATDYAAGRTGPSFVAGDAVTGSDGRWLAPIFLSPGNFTLFFYKPGVLAPTTRALTVN